MTSKDFSIKNLLSCLEISQLLESESGSSIWFAHLNLNDFTEIEIPDGGKIADYFDSCHSIEVLITINLSIWKGEE